MKKSNTPSKDEPLHLGAPALDFDFVLPDGRDFNPEPRRSNPDLCFEMCEHYLPIVMRRPGFWERRQAERCPAEFDLIDPTRVPVSYPAKFIDELLRRE